MKDFKTYYPTTEFALLANVSTKTISRLKKHLADHGPEINQIIKRRHQNYYHYTLLKKFLSDELYEIYRLQGESILNDDRQ